MFETRVTRLFGIKYPIVGGCMMNVSKPEFVAAVSNAGALGMMASAIYEGQKEFREAVRKVRALTVKPFGVNLSLPPLPGPLDNNLYADVILEEHVPIVETSGNRPPQDLLARLKSGGVKTMHKCVSVRHALSAQKVGVDAVTILGSEGGGHIGDLGLTTMTLVPRAVESLKVPVIASGGIVDGRGLLAALALGAEGVTIGTRLLVTKECPIHENLKHALVAASELDTLIILSSIQHTVRVWKNAAALKVAELESQQADVPSYDRIISATKQMYESGDVNVGMMPCSQGIGLVHEIKPVAEVIEGMMQEAAAAMEHLTK